MFRDITIGQYYDADSPIHRLDPRTKLFATFIFIAVLFLIKNPVWYVPCLALMLMLFKVAKVPLKFFFKGLKAILILLVLTFLFRMAYTPGDVVCSFWIFDITKQGIYTSIRMTSRIALMITGASLLSYTSTPKQLADGLEKSCGILSRIGIPVHDMAVITMIAFRFIPIMLEELNILMDAQAARGAEFEDAGVITKCRNVVTLLFPLFMSSIRKSGDLAMAMEARGYTGEGNSTKMYPLEYSRTDCLTYILAFLMLAFFIFVRVFH